MSLKKQESIMPTKKIMFKILRYKPGRTDPPRFQEFIVDAEPDTSVLDGLEMIRLGQDSTLMYRHSCHHSSCGTCACKINGLERLTCITKISELEDNKIELAPLDGFNVIGDLVVDMAPFYDDLSNDWSYLKKSDDVESIALPDGIGHFIRFENCIECGACISSCPVSHENSAFIGPAVLAAVNCELMKSPEKSKKLLALAGSKRGQNLCQRALNCSRVCPTGVYPARHIADLRKRMEKK